MADLTLLAFLAIPLVIALIGFFWFLWQTTLDRHAARYNSLRRFNPDSQGNYPAFFDPGSNQAYRIRAGNATVYPTQNFILQGGEARPAAPGRERRTYERPLVINSPRPIPVVQDVRLEQIEQPANRDEQAFTDEHDCSEPDFRLLLQAAKREGMPKIRAIETITGVKRGGGPVYKSWSEIWDSYSSDWPAVEGE